VIGDLAAAQSHAPGKEPSARARCVTRCQANGASDGSQHFAALEQGKPANRFATATTAIWPPSAATRPWWTSPSPLGPLRFSGYPAWLFWLFAHVYFLIGFRNRLVVLLDWAWAYWSFARYARVVTGIKPGDPPPR
jgi:NADH dehydrogenase